MIIQIQLDSEVPIYAQLRDQIVAAIAAGGLAAGEQLPSVRRLAADIGIHPHTVNKAYAVLRDEGYILMDRRSRCRVAAHRSPDAAFTAGMTAKLAAIAAEAVCHRMAEEDFLALCRENYRGVTSG